MADRVSFRSQFDLDDIRPELPGREIGNILGSETRQGIIEPHQFDKIIENLPEPLCGPVRLVYFCGWRIKSEVWSLEWHQVDRKRKVIHLDAKHSKNGEARDLPYEQLDDVIEVIETQWQAHQRLAEGGTICPSVFHRDGKPIQKHATSMEDGL